MQEQEARTDLLRSRARSRDAKTTTDEDVQLEYEGHINFFQELEEGVTFKIIN